MSVLFRILRPWATTCNLPGCTCQSTCLLLLQSWMIIYEGVRFGHILYNLHFKMHLQCGFSSESDYRNCRLWSHTHSHIESSRMFARMALPRLWSHAIYSQLWYILAVFCSLLCGQLNSVIRVISRLVRRAEGEPSVVPE